MIIIVMEKEKLGRGGGVSPGSFEFFHETRKINYRKISTWGGVGEVIPYGKII